MREATKAVLAEDPTLKVVAEAEDAASALELVAELLPDIVIADIRLRGSSGIELAKAINRTYPQVKVIALSAFSFDQYVRAMLKAGAKGFLLKDASGQELIRAIHEVYEGRVVFSSEVAKSLVALLTKEEKAWA